MALTNDRRSRDGVIPRDLLAIAPSAMGHQQWLFLHALHLAQPAQASSHFIGDAAIPALAPAFPFVCLGLAMRLSSL
jgi:hypothetical protein